MPNNGVNLTKPRLSGLEASQVTPVFGRPTGELAMVTASGKGAGDEELCSQCGHLFNPHRVLGYGSPPIEGWMECPVEGCGCQMTWSVEPDVAAQIRGSGALRRFWWPVPGHLGIGVTSYTKEEALRLAQAAAEQHGWQFEPAEVVEDVDIRQLDQGHVIPNMGVCSNRGVWDEADEARSTLELHSLSPVLCGLKA